MVNGLLGVMCAKGAKVYDDNDPDWYIDHLEYNKDADEIFFHACTE